MIIRKQPYFSCAGAALGERGLNDRVHLEQDEVFNSHPVLPILALPVLAEVILALPVLVAMVGEVVDWRGWS